MSVTVDQFFYSVYRYAGMVLKAGTGLDPDQTEECRTVYNSMTSAWAADGTTISHIGREIFDITPSQGDYTIGPSGQWEWPRVPRRVERASMVLTDQSPEPEYKLWPLTIDEWQIWTLKTQTSDWSRCFYYEYIPDLLGIAHLLYIPSDANQVALYLEHALSQIEATGDAELIFGDGVQEALETNLAIRIAARYPEEAKLSQDTRNLARSSLSLIRGTNNRPLCRENDLARGRGYGNTILTGNRYGI